MKTLICGVAFVALLSTTAHAATDADVAGLRAELRAMRNSYETRIAQLEKKLSDVEKAKAPPQAALAPAAGKPAVRDNSFNPSLGVILNGRYSSFSERDSTMAGFAIGEEGERGREGFAVDESEINFSANVDDKFSGGMTMALVREDGEDKIELEEAYVQTLPGMGLPQSMTLKAGRALWTLGYLNEHHTHADDFADRPLPYRAFLNNHFNDDGAQLSYVLPTDFYTEIGGGAFRGDTFPFGNAQGESIGTWSAFARVGGDIGENQSWRIGASMLSGDASGRTTNEDIVSFTGDTRLYIADIRYVWAPTGNNREQEVLLQGEYFFRDEDGTYEDTDAATGAVDFDDHSSGWYAQAVYKFLPQWRVGTRYSRLSSAGVPAGLAGSALDGAGHDPDAWALMADWSNSEFSRLRLQLNRERLSDGQEDNQLMLQYIMSLGAHAAHAY